MTLLERGIGKAGLLVALRLPKLDVRSRRELPGAVARTPERASPGG